VRRGATDEVKHSLPGVEVGDWILEEHLQPRSHLTQLRAVQPGQVGSIKQDASGCRARELQDRPSGGGFAAPGLADYPQCLSVAHRKAHIGDQSKEELLYRISLRGHQVALHVITDAAATSADPVERLTAMMRAFVRHHARHHTIARVVNDELGALSPEHQQEVFQIRKAIDRLMLEVIEAGVARGQFHTSNTRMTSVALLSLTVDVARWFRDDLAWTPDQVADHFSELALRIAGARTPPAG
jgi:AcrR family transcriptional regulator